MAELKAFRVGLASPANTFFAIWMAKAAELYKAYGLEVDIVPVVGGSKSGPDLDSGRIHLMHIGMSSVVRANSMGHDLVTIGSLSNIIRNTMFGAPGVSNPVDLKGGVIGISSVGSETDPTTTLALRKMGLSREDVTIKEIGVERLSAVCEGKVSASLMGEPYRSKALAMGMQPLIDLYADRTPWLYSGLVVSRKFLAEHRDLAVAFIKATVEGNYLALANPKQAKETLARELNLSDAKIINEAYENFKRETPINAELTFEGAKNIIDILQPANKDLAAYLDNSIHEELQNEGFFASMKTKYKT